MHCLKCGRKIDSDESFCPSCLADMEKYPVQPGTVVKLPSHSVDIPTKKRSSRRRKPVKPEDQITALKKRCRWLTILLLLAILAALIALAGMLWLLGWLDQLPLSDITFPFGR